ncbi:two-component system CitB family sensor kinase [Sediminihabitans luteus]|uniref:histidine kinase n=1 Tax=Sediminihabitans luteus TaxID=1138585 RepID=A0A2M9D0H4_9CELL|nr:sensor histidine kinase [Sediminihabitans luteus]PJJ77659.1 two-component system CitB family sensor kinase [Sediminihabitans luteus]
MPLRLQLLVLQLAVVLLVVSVTGAVATALQEKQLRDAYLDRMTGVALSVARLPAIVDAFDDADPSATVQPIAEVIREASDVTYVVVTDDAGLRLSHPDPDRIGELVSTDPSVPLSGEVWVGTQTGTLGESWRVKVPIFDAAGQVVGTASVGVLESELQDDLFEEVGWLWGAVGGAVVTGVVCAWWVTRLVRRRIFGLEPEEIAALLETRSAMLHAISEGVVAVDGDGRVALVNDEARRLLGLDRDVVGSPAHEVLDPRLCDLPEAGELVLVGERVLLARADHARAHDRDVGTVLVLRDHTELHALLRDLDGARGLTDALRAQSHEFTNKLHVVSGLLELGQVDEAVAFIERVGHGGLLTASSTAPHVGSPEVAALLLVKASTCRERGVDLDVDPASRLAAPAGAAAERLHADLLTVLGNLVDNAVDAAGPGGHVRVLVDDSASGVRLEVDDDGAGVPRALREAVWVAGFSTKALRGPGRGAPGRGIGLTLVRRIVERRGGDVRLTASPLGGARVAVVLPAPAVAADPHAPLAAVAP